MSSPSAVLLFFPLLLVTCQEYRVDYLCDFESGDCGLTTDSNTGAIFRRQEMEVAHKRTHALVLDGLSSLGNWSYGRTRSAVIRTPVIIPSLFTSPVVVSLDLFFDAGDCLQFLMIGQQVGERTETLEIINESSSTSWHTLSVNLLNPENPIRLSVEARLLPNCQDSRTCSCSGRAAVDNLRIRTAEEHEEEENQIQPPVRTQRQVEVSSGGGNFSERQVQQVDVPVRSPQYSHHWAHKWKFMGNGGYRPSCPPPPNCDNLVVVRVDTCPTEHRRDCISVQQAPCCNCPTVVYPQCPRVECPRVLPCDPPPTCLPPPIYPPDDKTWDPNTQHYP